MTHIFMVKNNPFLQEKRSLQAKERYSNPLERERLKELSKKRWEKQEEHIKHRKICHYYIYKRHGL